MSWTAPITWTTGQVVTAANLNEQIRDNEGALSTHTHTGAAGDGAQAIGSASLPIKPITEGVLLTKSGTQTITAGTSDVITFDTEVSDVGGMHESVTHPSYITIPSTGNYLIGAQVYASAGSGLSIVYLRLNGTTVLSIAFPGSGGVFGYSRVYRFTAGDYFEIYVTAIAGTNTTISTTHTTAYAQRIG